MKTSLPGPGQGGTRRIEALDTLRFIAALVVVVEHANSVFPVFHTPLLLRGVMNASSAVALFFVLSGYVLHLSFRSKDLHRRHLGAFTLKRLFRLYPLHFVALLLAAAVVFLLPLKDCAMLMNAEYARETLTHDHHDARQWLHQASLISGGMNTTFVNPPIWTLAAEMRISLIFPVVAFVVARTGLVTSGILTALSFLLGPWVASKTIATVGMIPLFCLGAFTAQWMNRVPTSQRSGLWVMLPGLVLYSAAAWMGRDLLGKEAPFYVAGLGAALMIAAMVRHPRLARLFSTPVLVRLGQLSYGIYLLHFPLLLAVTWAVEKADASGQMILPCLLVATLLLSWVLFHTVEKPFIAWGRRPSGGIGDRSVNAGF